MDRFELAWQALHFHENGRADSADYLIGLIHRDRGAKAACIFDRRTSGCNRFELTCKLVQPDHDGRFPHHLETFPLSMNTKSSIDFLEVIGGLFPRVSTQFRFTAAPDPSVD
jgi:hypothetical protein